MYEKFTDRARRVMQLADQEAQRFNHEYVGTEHILLGLVKEDSGIAADVLGHLNVNLCKVRREVEKLVQSGPDMVTMGKLPQTPLAKKAIEAAIDEARLLRHNYVGTEHILLGLLKTEGVGLDVLSVLGLDVNTVRSEVLNLLGVCQKEDIQTQRQAIESIAHTVAGCFGGTNLKAALEQIYQIAERALNC
jgi:ATP-dependent Clp protease ATP-binding subunit ClpC